MFQRNIKQNKMKTRKSDEYKVEHAKSERYKNLCNG